MKISVLVNTYNEEKNIEACLKSIAWADEIVVVDMNSSDKTVEIAKKYTNNITLIPKKSHVELGRNTGIDISSSEWILVLDADETLSPGDEQIIRKLIKNNEIEGYWLPRRQYLNNSIYLKHGYFFPDYQLRLFRNKKSIRYPGTIHEFPPIKKTLRLSEPQIKHNPSHSKFCSFRALIRSFPYIAIEGADLAKSNVTTMILIKRSLTEIIRHFFRSFIKKEGYKDGYNGFRAAILYGLYKGSICFYAAYLRLKRDSK